MTETELQPVLSLFSYSDGYQSTHRYGSIEQALTDAEDRIDTVGDDITGVVISREQNELEHVGGTDPCGCSEFETVLWDILFYLSIVLAVVAVIDLIFGR